MNTLGTAFRSKASFGKRIEYYIFGLMLRDGLDVYIPTVDDHGVDAIVKCPDGRLCEIQIKALSMNSTQKLFAAIKHPDKPIENFWFVFYLEAENPQDEKIYLLTSEEFLAEASKNTKAGSKHIGERSILFGRSRVKYAVKTFDRVIDNK